jgi:hypothetical protein
MLVHASNNSVESVHSIMIKYCLKQKISRTSSFRVARLLDVIELHIELFVQNQELLHHLAIGLALSAPDFEFLIQDAILIGQILQVGLRDG